MYASSRIGEAHLSQGGGVINGPNIRKFTAEPNSNLFKIDQVFKICR